MTSVDVTTVRVDGPTPYNVLVGHGLSGAVAAMLPGVSVVAVVRPDELAELAVPVADTLRADGVDVHEISVPAGESAKTRSTIDALWSAFAGAAIGRGDAVVAVGGGATTDVVGFAAATWLRGVRVVHVPTTLLGMVDAAIGGKTGINTDAGKNLVGAFHPPAGVVVDLDVLATLPVAEWVNGMAEVVKTGFIADPVILDLIDSDPDATARPDGTHVRELVERSIAVKAKVVSADLREAGLREVLNYGHTLAHAIEKVEDFRWPHGHAVSVGLVFAAALGRYAGRLDEPTAARHRPMLEQLGLPTTYKRDAWPRLLEAMHMDKKARAGRLRFIVLEAVGRPVVLEAPDQRTLETAYAEVAR